MNSVPIACTLTPEGIVGRVAAWSDFFAASVQDVTYDRYRAVLTLKSGSDVLEAGTRLAELEKACCSFFDFSLALDGSAPRLHIEAPAEAEPVLIGFLNLLPPALSPHGLR